MDLRVLGFKKGAKVETLVTTYHKNGSANAAPMGVSLGDEDELLLNVHLDTDTYENILRTGCCVVNIVYSPLAFLRGAVLGRHKGPQVIEIEETESAKHVKAPYLKNAHAYIECEMKDCKVYEKMDSMGHTRVAEIRLRVKKVKILVPTAVAPNRGFFATIEIAVALSRGRKREIPGYLDIIEKTLPPEEVREIKNFLSKYVDSKP